MLSLLFIFGFGGWLIYQGFHGLAVGIYLGFLIAFFGVLGLCGVNIWVGGPLDPRNDLPTPQQSAAVLDGVHSLGQAVKTGFMQWGIVLFSVLILLGIVFMCRIPYLARGSGVKPADVAIRCLDWHQAEPFYLIEGYEEAIAKVAIPWKTKRQDIRKIETQRTATGGYRHSVYNIAGGDPVDQVESLTPHTLLTPVQIQEAWTGLEQLYPRADRDAWAQVLSWGESLFLQWWSRNFEKESGYNGPVVEPWAGTEDEKIWFAWQRLSAGTRPADLPQLGKLARQAYPEESDYQAAMAWARTFHQRREGYYRAWLTLHRRLSAWETRFHGPAALPPPEDITLWWILHQHVGLNEESRAAARKRWLRYFPHKEAVALRWGQKLEPERRQANDSLPPSGDNVALVCVIERLTGWDDYGDKTRQVALQVLDPLPGRSQGSFDLYIQMALEVAYPSDDIFLLLASGDALKLGTLPGWDIMDRSQPLFFVIWFLLWLLMLAVFMFLLRCAFLDTLGGQLLFMTNHERFRAYYNAQTRTNWKALAIGVVLVPLAKWAWEWWKLAPPNEFLMPTVFHLLAGVYMGVLAGGLIILLINRLVAVLLIRFGYDVEKGWLDEIIGTTLGTILLGYFGNEWSSLLAFAAAAVLPEAFKRWWKLRHPPPVLLAPVTLTQAAAIHLQQQLLRDPARPGYIRVHWKQTSSGALFFFDPATAMDRPGDRLFVSRGVNLVVNDAQLETLRGLVVDHGGQPPGLLVYHPRTTNGPPPIPPEADETVYDREPLQFEKYPIASWIGLVLGVVMSGLILFAILSTSG